MAKKKLAVPTENEKKLIGRAMMKYNPYARPDLNSVTRQKVRQLKNSGMSNEEINRTLPKFKWQTPKFGRLAR